MYVKMMGPEDAPDEDRRKTFRLVQQVTGVHFERLPAGNVFANLTTESGQTNSFLCEGNVYVMNDQGKTVASFGPAPIPPCEEPGSYKGEYPRNGENVEAH